MYYTYHVQMLVMIYKPMPLPNCKLLAMKGTYNLLIQFYIRSPALFWPGVFEDFRLITLGQDESKQPAPPSQMHITSSDKNAARKLQHGDNRARVRKLTELQVVEISDHAHSCIVPSVATCSHQQADFGLPLAVGGREGLF